MKEFINNSSREERHRLFVEERRKLREPPEGTTYHRMANADLNLEGGRFAVEAGVSGDAAAVRYPELPASSPWAGADPAGVSPPLGYEIDQLVPVGTTEEIRRSLSAKDRGQICQEELPVVTAAGSDAHASPAFSPPSGSSHSVASEALPPQPPVVLGHEASAVLGRALRRRG